MPPFVIGLPPWAQNWNISYAGHVLPTPTRDGMVYELQPIDIAERNAAGDLMMEEVAFKWRIRVTWEQLNGQLATNLFKILHNNRYGKFTFWNPVTEQFDEIDAYYGAGASGTFRRYDDNMVAQRFNQFKANFIQR